MNTKRYWLQGGIFAVIIGAIVVSAIVAVSLTAHDINDAYGFIAEKIFDFFSHILLVAPLSDAGFSFGESLLIIAAYLFIIGAVAGIVYGKVKKQKY